MPFALVSPANAVLLGFPASVFSVLIPLLGLSALAYILWRRMLPLRRAAAAPRPRHIAERVRNTFLYPHHRMPRYFWAGAIHITILSGFIIIAFHWAAMVFTGVFGPLHCTGLWGLTAEIYEDVKDVSTTLVLIACIWAIVRRGFFMPNRYAVPPRYGRGRSGETIAALAMIAVLMVADMFFVGSRTAAEMQHTLFAGIQVPGTGVWAVSRLLAEAPMKTLQTVHLAAYYLHQTVLFAFLCFLPFGRFFHLLVALPNLFLMKLETGTVKPVRWDVPEETLDSLESFGVKRFEDFTWKHILDFYACADCGRCSDRCPANAVSRPLSPRFISIKGRDYAFAHYPLLGTPREGGQLIGSVYDADEIWSCTTCGACEAECPLMIQYIDKIVDLRRGMVDDGNVPQSLQKPLLALQKRGNPYGAMERKRADWARPLAETTPVKVLKNKTAPLLYFVDSVSAYDERLHDIARATARVLAGLGEDFGVLGPAEKDSGHEVRRFGEELLFQDLRDHNTAAIHACGAERIVTGDPHAFNALRHDYADIPPAFHISQVLQQALSDGRLRFEPLQDPGRVYTYHDPCYLGRHNEIYEAPRQVLDAIPGLNRVEMTGNCRDRSFCCGGGGLMLFYEPIEERRMGQLRVEMAVAAGADVIVTACPFCLINIEDAIKTSGLEDRLTVVDLVEIAASHMVQKNNSV